MPFLGGLIYSVQETGVMMRVSTRYFLLLALSFVSLSPSPSQAQNDEEKNQLAKQLFDNGIRMFESGQYQVAADSFREAYKVRPSWKIFYNIGQTESAAGRYGLALESFQQYLAQGKDDVPGDRKDYVLNEIRRLRDLVGDLEVEAPDSSVIYVDGVERGTLPLLAPILVEAGVEHDVIVVASDGKWTRKLKVWSGKSVRLKCEDKDKQALAKQPPTPMAVSKPKSSPSPEPPISGTSPREGEGVEGASGEPKAESRGLDPLYVWIGLGATGAFGVCALGIDLGVEAKLRDYKKHPSRSLKNEGEALQPAGIAFFALTGAALVTTGILAIFTDWESLGGETKSAVSIAPFASADQTGVGVAGRF